MIYTLPQGMLHKDIRIQFDEIKGRLYEAVGFLNKDEQSINGEEMFRRTNLANRPVIGKEDVDFLSVNIPRLPPAGLGFYNLVTNFRDSEDPRFTLCADKIDVYINWFGLNNWWRLFSGQWDEHDLVVRRCR